MQMDAEKVKNRAFRVHDVVTTQNELMRLAKAVVPDVEWDIKRASTEDLKVQAIEGFKADPKSRMADVMQKAVAVFGVGYTSDFGEADNAELKIGMMEETQVKAILKAFA